MSKTYSLYTTHVENKCQDYVKVSNSITKTTTKLAKPSTQKHPKYVAYLQKKLVKLNAKQTALSTKIAFNYVGNVNYITKHLH